MCVCAHGVQIYLLFFYINRFMYAPFIQLTENELLYTKEKQENFQQHDYYQQRTKEFTVKINYTEW